MQNLKVGSKVRILHFRTSVTWHESKPEEFGFITRIDGAYIYIRPRWKKWEIEKYPDEIRLVKK